MILEEKEVVVLQIEMFNILMITYFYSLGMYFFTVRSFTGFPFLVLLHTSIVFIIKMSFERTLKTKGFLAPLVAIVNILGKVIYLIKKKSEISCQYYSLGQIVYKFHILIAF